MSAGATTRPASKPTTQIPPRTNTVANLKLWPMVLLLAAFWPYLYYDYYGSHAQGERFILRLAAYLVLFLGFFSWWLSRSAFTWRERFGALGLIVLLLVAVSQVADKSMDVGVLLFIALPFVITIWVLWLAAARSFTPDKRRVGFLLAMLATVGFFGLLRSEGVQADQTPQLLWRWIPTSESLFLASQSATSKSGSSEASVTNPWAPQPGDCLEFRGKNRDGIVSATTIRTDWAENPPKQLWTKKVGPSWSGVIVVDGHLVAQEQRGEKEVVACCDAATGTEIWVHEDEARFEEALAGAGPRGTPTFADGKIFTFGAKGKLNCLKAETGEVVWSHDCVAESGLTERDLPQWGYSVSPLVVDGTVIVFVGGDDKGLTVEKPSRGALQAYNAEDGKLAWSSAGGKQSYSSPQVMTLAGKKQILMSDTSGLAGYNIADGARLWLFPSTGAMALPMLQPHAAQTGGVVGDGYVVTSTEPGAANLLIKQDGEKWSATADWTNPGLKAGFDDFVLHEGHLYALDDGVLCCINLADGKRLWKKGRLGHGQILSLPDQGLLLISSDKGELILVSADRAGYKELGRFQAIEGKTWNGPTLAQGRVFLRNGEDMAAYELNPQSASQPSATAPEKQP